LVDHLSPSGQPPLRLLAAPLTEWPDSLLRRLRERWEISVGSLDYGESASDAPLLLAYTHPTVTLAAALAGPTTPDIAALLDAWQGLCAGMLALRRRWPDRVLLIDPSQLDPAAETLLLERLNPHGGGSESAAASEAPTESATAVPPQPQPSLPAAVAFYLAQRSDLTQLFADLEGNAELLGREPRLGPVAPLARGLVLAEHLLADWQAEGSRHQREIGAERSALGQQIEQGQGELAEARREAEELRARLQDSDEERELILLQLQQVQDQLVRTFDELSQARDRGEEAEQRLARLEQECRTLFLHSQLSPGIDRSRIATILQLMRDSLQV
jgi:hypothetical protein